MPVNHRRAQRVNSRASLFQTLYGIETVCGHSSPGKANTKATNTPEADQRGDTGSDKRTPVSNAPVRPMTNAKLLSQARRGGYGRITIRFQSREYRAL